MRAEYHAGFYFVAQVVFQCISPFIVDNYGRRVGMYCFAGFMLAVSPPFTSAPTLGAVRSPVMLTLARPSSPKSPRATGPTGSLAVFLAVSPPPS